MLGSGIVSENDIGFIGIVFGLIGMGILGKEFFEK